jgi:plasmid stabilization system protein ParE
LTPVFFSDEANTDLEILWAQLASLSELGATNVLLRIVEACLSLTELPRRHPIEPRVRGRATRRFNLERYVILYSVGADRIEILRVLPGEVDLERVLGNR